MDVTGRSRWQRSRLLLGVWEAAEGTVRHWMRLYCKARMLVTQTARVVGGGGRVLRGIACMLRYLNGTCRGERDTLLYNVCETVWEIVKIMLQCGWEKLAFVFSMRRLVARVLVSVAKSAKCVCKSRCEIAQIGCTWKFHVPCCL